MPLPARGVAPWLVVLFLGYVVVVVNADCIPASGATIYPGNSTFANDTQGYSSCSWNLYLPPNTIGIIVVLNQTGYPSQYVYFGQYSYPSTTANATFYGTATLSWYHNSFGSSSTYDSAFTKFLFLITTPQLCPAGVQQRVGLGASLVTYTPFFNGFNAFPNYGGCVYNLTINDTANYNAIEVKITSNAVGTVTVTPLSGSPVIVASSLLRMLTKSALLVFNTTTTGQGVTIDWSARRSCVGTLQNIIPGNDISTDIGESGQHAMPVGNCSFLISTSTGRYPLIGITSMPYDQNVAVTIFDGSTSSAPVLFKCTQYCSGSPSFSANANNMLVIVTYKSASTSYNAFTATTAAPYSRYCTGGYKNVPVTVNTVFQEPTPYNETSDQALPIGSCYWNVSAPRGAYGIKIDVTGHLYWSTLYFYPQDNEYYSCLGSTNSFPYSIVINPIGLVKLYTYNHYMYPGYSGPGINATANALYPSQCTGYGIAVNGTIANPLPNNAFTAYNNNANCTWLLPARTGQSAGAVFFYGVGLADTCAKDYLRVYDGTSLTSPVLATICAGTTTAFIVGTQPSLLVQFVSDGTNQGTGFSFSSQCNGTLFMYDQTAGTITPGGDSENVLVSSRPCGWVIYVSDDMIISYTLIKPSSSSYVSIYDGDSAAAGYSSYSSGTNTGRSSRNSLYVKWQPASSTSQVGFKFSFTATAIDNPNGYFSSPSNGNVFWTQFPAQYGGTRGLNGGVPSYSQYLWAENNYYGNGPRYFIVMKGLSIAPSAQVYIQQSGTTIKTYQGPMGPQLPWLMPTLPGYYEAYFASPGSSINYGFLMYKATYNPASKSCLPVTTYGNASGIFTLQVPNASATYYDNDLLCYQLVNLTAPSFLTITAMDIEDTPNCVGDSLSIYDGNSTAAPLLGTYCGNQASQSVRGTSMFMLLVFHSNGFGGKHTGFKAYIAPGLPPPPPPSPPPPPPSPPPSPPTSATATATATATGTATATATATAGTDGSTTSDQTTTAGGTSTAAATATATGIPNDAVVSSAGGSGSGGDGSLLGIIIGIVVVVLIIVVIIVVILMRKKKGGKGRDMDDDEKRVVALGLQEPTVRASLKHTGLAARVEGMLNAPTTRQIGTGGTAKVFKAAMDDKWVALKLLSDVDAHAREEFHREANILGRLTGKENKNVIQLIFFCDAPACLVCELAENGSLARIRPEFPSFPLTRKKNILLQVAEGMEFLHANDVVHLDLKPDNILIGVNETYKVTDFGSSAVLGVDLDSNLDGLTTVVDFNGTPQYASPERFRAGLKIDLKKADVYSFGVMAWSLAAGQAPYSGETGHSIMEMYASARGPLTGIPLDFAVLPQDDVYRTVLRECIENDFKVRPHFRDIAGMLRFDSPDRTRVATLNPDGFASSVLASSRDSSVVASKQAFNTQIDNNDSMVASSTNSQNPAPMPMRTAPPLAHQDSSAALLSNVQQNQ